MDRLFGAYLLLSGAALLGPHRPSWWPLLAALHLAGAWLAFGAPGLPRPRPASLPRPRHWLLDLYPLLVVPALYAELVILNTAVWGGHYFDPVIQAVERAVFHSQPSRDLAPAAPWPWLSEPLHAAYLSYYFIIYLPPLLIWAARGREALRDTVFAIMLAFFVHYVFFIYFPVQGPRYIFAAPAADVLGGYPVNRLAHRLLEAGSSRGAAFPSSHVGVSAASTVMCFRYLPRWAPIPAVLTLMLAVGAVYGGFHYGTDAASGLLLGVALALVAPRLRARLA